MTYQNYQQYYRGVEVEDHGFILTGGGDPCDEPISSNFLYSDIGEDFQLETTPEITEEEVKSILDVESAISTLKIINGYTDECSYKLIWESVYTDFELKKKAIINAINGDIISVRNFYAEANFTSEIVGSLYKNDLSKFSENNTKRTASTSDFNIIFYDPEGKECSDLFPDELEDLPLLDPLTPQAETVKEQFENVLTIFEDEGITFGDIHIVLGCRSSSASSGDTNDNDVYIELGNSLLTNGLTCEIIAHEIAHQVIFPFIDIDANEPFSRILSESIADMYAFILNQYVRGDKIGLKVMAQVCQ